ncbi:unnamed protein product [Eruca vesicaria subsp. sativa]|uniref:Defensin-like domain-containing protein n=1 Tax=Eruca vesicaria subsp. sativa TaxID=29727 RepID=A0ABC8K9V8_ERUVS|nr:unnamed protein product [Eruca vesicaria subsp. sativa]
MGSTKTFMTCLLVLTLAVSLSNLNVLVSGKLQKHGTGAETEKFSYENCYALCTDSYDWWECQNDCAHKGYHTGECASPSPKVPKKCCCQKF